MHELPTAHAFPPMQSIATTKLFPKDPSHSTLRRSAFALCLWPIQAITESALSELRAPTLDTALS